MNRALLTILVWLVTAASVAAHEMRPAYLELKQTSESTYSVLWKVPGRGEDLRLALDVVFPDGTTNASEHRAVMQGGAFTERWTIRREVGLDGGTVRIAGLSETMTDVLVRLERLDGTTQVSRLLPTSPSFIVEPAPRALDVAATYTALGVEHILQGVDHLLFVLGLLILTRGGWKLVKTVTAFTISHSLTLTAATLGWVHVPPPPVEACIALSIMFVAAEILRVRQGEATFTSRNPWLVAFVFGLMHGLGFAGGLSEAGLPESHIPVALLFFSMGVETGHFLFIGAVLAAWWLLRRSPIAPPRWADIVPSYAIGGIAAFWFLDRTISFVAP